MAIIAQTYCSHHICLCLARFLLSRDGKAGELSRRSILIPFWQPTRALDTMTLRGDIWRVFKQLLRLDIRLHIPFRQHVCDCFWRPKFEPQAHGRTPIWAVPHRSEFPDSGCVLNACVFCGRSVDGFCVGIVYSDIGTSPLYVLNGIWPTSGPVPPSEDIIGGISAIIWSLTIVPLLKYASPYPVDKLNMTYRISFRLAFRCTLEPRKVSIYASCGTSTPTKLYSF